MRDEQYSPFKGAPSSDPPSRKTVTVFVMARFRGDQTDAMRGSLRSAPHGWEAVYLLNGELYRMQRFGSAALARADLATNREALAAAGWQPVPFRPIDGE